MDGLKVQYTDTNTWTQYILNSPINPNLSAKFKLKVVQTQHNNIMIGVTDYAKQKDQRYSYSSGNAMCYYGYDGSKSPSKDKEGGGFKQGDIFEVGINRATSTIKYSVNGTVNAIHTHDVLSDNSRVFMPYVEMHNTNDAVEWLMNDWWKQIK